MKKLENKNKKLLKEIKNILKNVPKAPKGTATKSIREDRDKN